LIVWTSLLIPLLSQVTLGFRADRTPDAVPSIQLVILPLVSTFPGLGWLGSRIIYLSLGKASHTLHYHLGLQYLYESVFPDRRTVHYHDPQLTFMQLFIGLLLAVISSYMAYRAKSLSRDGAFAAALMGTIIFGLAGGNGLYYYWRFLSLLRRLLAFSRTVRRTWMRNIQRAGSEMPARSLVTAAWPP